MADTPSPGDSAAGEEAVGADEGGLRLDRWFRRHYPGVPHGRLEKLLRSGQIRIDGAQVPRRRSSRAGAEDPHPATG